MTFLPVRVRPLSDEAALCVNDAGRFFAGSHGFVDRLLDEALTPMDRQFLAREGHALEADDPLGLAAHLHGVAERLSRAGPLDYLILVPTLRCNLSCSYCQVSRAGLAAPGFDWSEETLAAVLACLDALSTDRIKIEFQGGEPTLRPDLLRAVIARCERFAERQFVVCTNLQQIDDEILALFDRPDLFISTSLDGDATTHGRNRTGGPVRTDRFLANLRTVVDRYGPGKVSALPTIDATAPPDIDTLIEAYAAHGLDSIFLRPINFQGFARKRHKDAREQDLAWRAYYERFVRAIIARNWRDRGRVLEETYLSIALRRIFQPGRDRHVDLRNPNPMGLDYIVVDHDGMVYPTDEARMLARSGIIDLSIGDVRRGWDSEARDQLNAHATNQFDPACQRCAYQPYCGRDLVDDIARYGRIDMPRLETEFCRRHLHLFDFVFALIYSDDPAVIYSLSRWLRLPGTPASLGARLQ
ncbi:His-Xaa-Ser system radical SAM maturase HxsB [Flavisphingomonas formosensis]|uniref:His-Xaa-Ser system radical SAM maturase HxsB n=1 Tax=Flavisphingomonas formosensis TaxID=861534 RepID=UPI0012F8648C|nr:His-Xaa-Ser system radical SAM maturase HxsB [Sphingomonas formosensis]